MNRNSDFRNQLSKLQPGQKVQYKTGGEVFAPQVQPQRVAIVDPTKLAIEVNTRRIESMYANGKIPAQGGRASQSANATKEGHECNGASGGLPPR